MRRPLPKVNPRLSAKDHEADVCVVGAGLAGLCAALAAARHGARTVLMHDRPVLGGNASSECRMHICGADRANALPHLRETGILEELRLENLYRNPTRSFSVWDLVLYEKALAEPNLTLLLNCSCLDARMRGPRIESATGWQLTTQTHHRVRAHVFADCSGDSILAPLTGAACRMGREGRDEFGESLAPERPDSRTMGMTCLFGARRCDGPQRFVAPAWARRLAGCDELPQGARGHGYWEQGYWWIELGGEADAIGDAEAVRHELLKITLGVWDHIKNSGRHDADHWALDWIQFLPAKRESRRCEGDHILRQQDIEAGGRFEDIAGYGGWPMDDHDPAGFAGLAQGKPPNVFHPSPSPYGIPYRCLYSRNVDNLMFAGRNISCTHIAMSSTRVMGTCSAVGQAAGTAAAMAAAGGVSPREVGSRIGDLQAALMRDDCYLPGLTRPISPLCASGHLEASAGDPAPLRDGVGRQIGENPHAWVARPGSWSAYGFDPPRRLAHVDLILDSGMDQLVASVFQEGSHSLTQPPSVMPREFRVEVLKGGTWQTAHRALDNHQRFVRLAMDVECSAVRFTLDRTWGATQSRVYGFYVE
jgi:hypothetical protein